MNDDNLAFRMGDVAKNSIILLGDIDSIFVARTEAKKRSIFF